MALSQRERTASALVAYHTARRHGVQLGYLGGVVFVFLTQQETNAFNVSPPSVGLPSLALESETLKTHAYGADAEVGMDADVSLGRRFSVVPQVRLVADGVRVRPGIALRARW